MLVWYNPFFLWFMLGIIALVLMFFSIDRELYYHDLKLHLKANDIFIVIWKIILLYIYLPYSIPIILTNQNK